jgi:hypothetical protein
MIAFWNIAPCRVVELDRRFRGANCLRHQGDEGLMMAVERVQVALLDRLQIRVCCAGCSWQVQRETNVAAQTAACQPLYLSGSQL